MPEVQDRIEKLGNSILSDAQKKAEEIISKAQQQADELSKRESNTDAVKKTRSHSTDRRPILFTQRNYQRATLPHISRCLLTGAGL